MVSELECCSFDKVWFVRLSHVAPHQPRIDADTRLLPGTYPPPAPTQGRDAASLVRSLTPREGERQVYVRVASLWCRQTDVGRVAQQALASTCTATTSAAVHDEGLFDRSVNNHS